MTKLWLVRDDGEGGGGMEIGERKQHSVFIVDVVIIS